MRLKKLFYIILFFISLYGCSFHKFEGKEYALQGADKRLIYTISANNKDLQYRNKNNPDMILCAEPSPDIAIAISKALSAGLEGSYSTGEKTVAGRAYATMSATQSVAQLGERLATIQLIRDEMSDLCRAYANGAVSMTTYTIRLSRLDRKMVTLLLGELNAGAFGRNLASLTSQASAADGMQGTIEEIKKATEETLSAAKAVSKAEEDLKNNKDDAKKDALNQDIETKKKEFARKLTVLTSLQLANSMTNVMGTAATSIGAITDRTQTSNDNLNQMHSNYLTSDDMNVLLDACVSATDIHMDLDSVIIKTADQLTEKAETLKKAAQGTLTFSQNANKIIEQLANTTITISILNNMDKISEEINKQGVNENIKKAGQDMIDKANELRTLRETFLSPFGRFCMEDKGLPEIIKHIKETNSFKLQISEIVSENQLLLQCIPYLKDPSSVESNKLKKEFTEYCDSLLKRLLSRISERSSSPGKTETAITK